jgi:hypothetical protein
MLMLSLWYRVGFIRANMARSDSEHAQACSLTEVEQEEAKKHLGLVGVANKLAA